MYCPYCSKRIEFDMRKCPYCKRELPFIPPPPSHYTKTYIFTGCTSIQVGTMFAELTIKEHDIPSVRDVEVTVVTESADFTDLLHCKQKDNLLLVNASIITNDEDRLAPSQPTDLVSDIGRWYYNRSRIKFETKLLVYIVIPQGTSVILNGKTLQTHIHDLNGDLTCVNTNDVVGHNVNNLILKGIASDIFLQNVEGNADLHIINSGSVALGRVKNLKAILTDNADIQAFSIESADINLADESFAKIENGTTKHLNIFSYSVDDLVHGGTVKKLSATLTSSGCVYLHECKETETSLELGSGRVYIE